MPVRTRSGRSFLLQIGAGCMAAAVSLAAVDAQQDSKDGKDSKDAKKPSVAIRVAPPISFSPARVVITAELRGGAVDDPELVLSGNRVGLGRRHQVGSHRELRALRSREEHHQAALDHDAHVPDAGHVPRPAAPEARAQDHRVRQQHGAGQTRSAGPEQQSVLTGNNAECRVQNAQWKARSRVFRVHRASCISIRSLEHHSLRR